ncbi:putative xylose-proton symporter [Asticcacaulis biprosthecium C19]|uniref:Putative xylose-proton symporter n=1 Tax=Asticcacaulis biprosthecium C19 TaxID=715226 RepID=F4QPX1_9CAUL|nr:MFS transporter [Asticcacaulis biprosthecium]EGF90258.1 putative xylose-proton symporter [Asticcacaulis biprosthecium C19]
MTQTTQRGGKPSWLERITYGFGDFGFNLYWATISSFLLYFYTDSFGLAPATAGTMLLVVKLIDACVDPVMGAIADRTKSKWGRFRPWLLWGSLPLALFGVITFITPDLSLNAKLVYAALTFGTLGALYSVANIPYGALSAVITNDPQIRTQINSFRFVGGFLGTTFVNYFTLKFVAWFDKQGVVDGWPATMGLYGLLACFLFAVLAVVTRERIQPGSEEKVSPFKDIGDLMQNRPWVILFILALIIMVTISTRAGASIYYIKYFAGGSDADAATFLTVYGMALALGSLLTPVLTRFIDKKRLLIILMTLVGILSCAFYFVPKGDIVLMYGLQAAIGLCLGPKSPLTFSMYADAADYNEHKTGRRATGMTFAAATFSQKMGAALASAVIGWVLASMGYVAKQAQTGASQEGIVLLMSFVPGAVAFISVAVLFFYNLDDTRLKTIQADLDARKAQN